MPAVHVGVVARRRILDQQHVADQPRARIAAFEQVVAQDAVLGQAIAQHVLEGVDLVDALADERAFVEHVLVDVGDGAGVRVDARLAAEQPPVVRSVRGGQARADPRLQDAVAARHHRRLGRAAEARRVERVRHRGDELPGGVARQLRVGVERDHVAHARQLRRVAHDQREAVAGPHAGPAAQQRVQVGELAALALVAHPQPLLLVPAARAVEEEEAVAAVRLVSRRAVLAVQLFHLRARLAQQHVVVVAVLVAPVEEVGEQAVVQLRIAVGEIAHLERLDQVGDALLAAEHRRHDDQRAALRWNAEREVHARQVARCDEQARDPVHERHRQLAGRQQGDRAGGQQPPSRRGRGEARIARVRRPQHRQADLQQRQAADSADIQPQRPPVAGAAHPLPGHEAHQRHAFEHRPAAVDEPPADMCLLRPVGAGTGGSLARQLDRRAGQFVLGQRAVPGHALDRVAIVVARREVHAGVHVGRVLAQRLLHMRQRLDELAPVGRAEQAQAADAVADRHLRGRLVLRLQLHQLLDVLLRVGQVLLDPRQRQRQRGAARVQPARQLGDEGRRHRRVGPRHVGDDQDQPLRVLLGHVEHAVGPAVGELALADRRGDAHGDAAQVLDQRQPQHDRDRPQLAELEHLDGLVRRDEAGQRAAAQATVAMRDGLQRQVIDPRQPRRRPGGQARQLAAVARRQVQLRGAYLFLDEVEVVEQPFAGRRDRPLQLGQARQLRRDVGQHRPVRRKARQQAVGGTGEDELVRRREALAVLRHLVGGEQLRSQRRLFGARQCLLHGVVQAGPRHPEPARGLHAASLGATPQGEQSKACPPCAGGGHASLAHPTKESKAIVQPLGRSLPPRRFRNSSTRSAWSPTAWTASFSWSLLTPNFFDQSRNS